MVQSIGINQENSFGTVKRIGENNNGRIVYELTSPEGNVTNKVSISQQDCDIFEKSYEDIKEVSPKIMAFQEKYGTPEAIKKQQKKASWTIGSLTVLGAGIPLLRWKGGAIIGSLITLLGGIGGFILGGTIVRATTPKPEGVEKFQQAIQNLTQIDVKTEE